MFSVTGWGTCGGGHGGHQPHHMPPAADDDDWELDRKIASLATSVVAAGRAADARAASLQKTELDRVQADGLPHSPPRPQRTLSATPLGYSMDDDDDHWDVPVPKPSSDDAEPAVPVAIVTAVVHDDSGDGFEAFENSLRLASEHRQTSDNFSDLGADDGEASQDETDEEGQADNGAGDDDEHDSPTRLRFQSRQAPAAGNEDEWATAHEGGIELCGADLRSYHSDKVLRATVAQAVSEAERRAKQRQLKAVERAVDAAAEQLKQELEAQAVELEGEHERRLLDVLHRAIAAVAPAAASLATSPSAASAGKPHANAAGCSADSVVSRGEATEAMGDGRQRRGKHKGSRRERARREADRPSRPRRRAGGGRTVDAEADVEEAGGEGGASGEEDEEGGEVPVGFKSVAKGKQKRRKPRGKGDDDANDDANDDTNDDTNDDDDDGGDDDNEAAEEEAVLESEQLQESEEGEEAEEGDELAATSRRREHREQRHAAAAQMAAAPPHKHSHLPSHLPPRGDDGEVVITSWGAESGAAEGVAIGEGGGFECALERVSQLTAEWATERLALQRAVAAAQERFEEAEARAANAEQQSYEMEMEAREWWRWSLAAEGTAAGGGGGGWPEPDDDDISEERLVRKECTTKRSRKRWA